MIAFTFEDPRDFAAEHRARRFLESAGFSVGRKQAHAPSGILFGSYDIQKWRNLSAADREALHGVMTSEGRSGPVKVEIFDTAPDAARAALATCEAEACRYARPFQKSRNLFQQRGETLMRHVGEFEGERLSRARGYRTAASPARDWSSGLSVIAAIALMYLIIGVGFHEVQP